MSASSYRIPIKTLTVSARRFELSPYNDCYAHEGTIYGVYAGRFYASYNGEDVAETYWALRRKAVLYDVPERPVQIEGPDALPFLERIFARQVATLTEGRGRYALACTPTGGVFMGGILFKVAENCFWYVQPDGPLEAWLLAQSDGFDVQISDPKSRVLQIQGPAAPAILDAASKGAINADMTYFHSGFFDLGGQQLYVSRTGWTGELGYEIYSLGAQTDHPRLWDHLLSCGAPHGMVFGSVASMGIRRIEAGILDNLSDFDTSMTPFEAGLGPFNDLDKEGFIGREALLDAPRETLLYGLKTKTAAPVKGDQILDGATAVGRVTAGAHSPFLESGIGFVRFARPGGWEGRSLSLQSASGEAVDCKIVALPFYDAEKRIPRGLDREIP